MHIRLGKISRNVDVNSGLKQGNAPYHVIFHLSMEQLIKYKYERQQKHGVGRKQY